MGFSSSVELKGFDGLVDVIKSAKAVPKSNVEEQERKNESNATTAPLNYNEKVVTFLSVLFLFVSIQV